MSIQNIVGNVGSMLSNAKDIGVQYISANLQNLIGGATAKLETLWNGGFVGIDTDNALTLKDEIEKYIARLNDIIEGFNTETYIGGALKGQAAEAASEYVSAIKTLISAYITTYRNFNDILLNTVESMKSGDTENANAIRTDAQAIITQANNIRVD